MFSLPKLLVLFLTGRGYTVTSIRHLSWDLIAHAVPGHGEHKNDFGFDKLQDNLSMTECLFMVFESCCDDYWQLCTIRKETRPHLENTHAHVWWACKWKKGKGIKQMQLNQFGNKHGISDKHLLKLWYYSSCQIFRMSPTKGHIRQLLVRRSISNVYL